MMQEPLLILYSKKFINKKTMNTTVTISLKEFDELRSKVDCYDKLKMEFDELKEKNDRFQNILKSRMKNVLSTIVCMQSGETDYAKEPKLNHCDVTVKSDVTIIKRMTIKIGELNIDGYYNAEIVCHYDDVFK